VPMRYQKYTPGASKSQASGEKLSPKIISEYEYFITSRSSMARTWRSSFMISEVSSSVAGTSNSTNDPSPRTSSR